ncbi:hypothetical protein EYR36_002706 [Pleurotus pulmonarius]|nr:hypothetical protein EYR36_002706 [Pleurotus pulmonarius]
MDEVNLAISRLQLNTMAATEDTHCYCPPILFILESNEQTVEEDDQIYGPFYLVSWGNIANIYTGDAMYAVTKGMDS